MPTQAGRLSPVRRATPGGAAAPLFDESSAPFIAPAAVVDDLRPGAQIGEYVLTEKIGEGGMGVVWGGVHPVIGKRVAIKLLNPGLSQDASIVQRFLQEARAVNQIGHRNIVDIFAFGQLPSGRHYFVMDRLAGGSLKERLEQVPPLSQRAALSVLAEVADALAAAHAQGIVHRDLKPDNIFLSDDAVDGVPAVKLLDFGIAKLLRRSDDGGLGQTRTGAPLGTPFYMSPEQCRSKGVDARTDIYSMGVIMFEVFTGRLPFAGEDYIETVNQHLGATPPLPSDFALVPAELESLILACLEKEPERRPQQAEALRTALRELLPQVGDEPVPPPRRDPGRFATSPAVTPGANARPTVARATPARRTPPPAKRSGRAVALWTSLGGLGVAALAAALVMTHRRPPPAPPPPSTIELEVTTEPPGATLLVDGRAQPERSPAELRVPFAAEIAVRAEKPGYRARDELVRPPAGATRAPVTLHLAPLPAQLRAHANAADTAWQLDGAPIGVGATVQRDDVVAGSHVLRAEARGFVPRQESVRFTGGESAVVDWVLSPAARHRRALSPSAVPDAPNLDFKAPR